MWDATVHLPSLHTPQLKPSRALGDVVVDVILEDFIILKTLNCIALKTLVSYLFKNLFVSERRLILLKNVDRYSFKMDHFIL